jgi:hypothetical protein
MLAGNLEAREVNPADKCLIGGGGSLGYVQSNSGEDE